jgi:putative endonuclease
VATVAAGSGHAAEVAARRHLEQQGLRLVAANAASRRGEVDLVLIDPRAQPAVLVFVEVRYRASTGFGGGAASVDAGKRRRLVRAAAAFLARHPEFNGHACRFDVVDASGPIASPTLRWIEDAFRADDA